MKTIEITVSPKGETEIVAKGYEGSSCINATRYLERALGTKTREQSTLEFFLNAVTEETAKEGL